MKGVITSKERKLIQEMQNNEDLLNFMSELPVFELKYLAAMKEIETKMKILTPKGIRDKKLFN